LNAIDWPPPRRRRRTGRLFLLVAVAVLLLAGGTALSYYVEALWYGALGYGDVFWKTLNFQADLLIIFTVATFAVLYGGFLLLKPARLDELAGRAIVINGQPLRLPVEPVLRAIAGVVALFVAVITGLGMMAAWPTFAQYWYGAATHPVSDPIFSRPITFYLFTLPAWQLLAGWFTTLAFVTCGIAVFFAVVSSGTRALIRQTSLAPSLRGVSVTFGFVLISLAMQTYLGRFERLFDEHQTFGGASYTDAHVAITGMLIVAMALLLGAAVAFVNAVVAPRLRWLIASVVPAAVVYVVVGLVGWYVNTFLVKPNELVRERPFIANNIEFTRRAYALDRIEGSAFPAETGLEALDLGNNQDTVDNIRLWDWRALQDTLRQIQEIRTYYDFPDIDIDRYEIDGRVRQVMLATRELNVERLPESSRNWINEKLIYTHGYGVTMNPVNGFTPEGLPDLLLGNMPVQSKVASLTVKRPEIYFGELTNTNVYVRTRQQEFNYPQGDNNNLTTYEGSGGISIGGLFRRLLIALDQGDIAKLPFSDDVHADSRLLMRRNIRDRVQTLAPFLTLDTDPYIVVTAEGRLVWMIDAYTSSASYPYSTHYRLGRDRLNYLRNSVKVTVDAYEGSVDFYVFDPDDPIAGAYRALFPSLFKDASAMPADLRRHVRYPELMLELQASVYGLYHMTTPEVFYNREDLWTVASEVAMDANRRQATLPMEPNFVLMKLPGQQKLEFVEILPFTPANRNNLIGWIAGRSDDANYGTAVVYDFPKTLLVDGPLQIEARIDQNAQLSGQLSLWNQQGSHVRRGTLLVIPVGRALLYAEPIYLQAERSPMPELRIVVLALQDRLAYGPSFESALAALLGNAQSTLSLQPGLAPQAPRPPSAAAPTPTPPPAPASGGDLDSLISAAGRDLADYQRLTAEGRLGEAGQRLEALKQKLEQLQNRRR
jgi:uncharacterized membrane protein (UPF0182 family)